MGAEARRLKAKGIEVLDFALGEPDFDTPANIQEAAIKAMRSGQTHYTPPAGIPELRQAVADLYTRQHGLPTDAGPGGHLQRREALDPQCTHGGLRAGRRGDHSGSVLGELCRPGEADRCDARHRDRHDRGAGFKLTPDQFLAAVTPRTKLLMINSPSNPTGVVYDRSELTALADAVLQTDVGVLSDEIYEQLTYGDAQPTCFATLRPGLADRTITISGVSKTYAMTGWRIGWAIAPAPVAKFMGDLQSQETSNPCSVSQWAALEAITGPAGLGRRDEGRVSETTRLCPRPDRRLAGCDCLPPGGAFYAFMNISAHFGRTWAASRSSIRPPSA